MGESDSFLKLRYTGARFEDAAIPLSCLGELSALQRALNDLYRFQYRLQNSDRKRVPKGYKDALVLALSAIEKGSTVACLDPRRPYQQTLSEEMGDALNRSVQAFLDFVEGGRSLQPEMQRVMTNCVKELGSSLQDDEAIILERGDRKVKYDQEVRRKLLRQLNSSFSRTEEQVFAVSEFDKVHKSFELCSPDGGTCKVQFTGNPQLEKTAYEAFQEFEGLDKNVKVIVSGEFSYDGNGNLSKVNPETFELLGERDLRWRIPFLLHRNAADERAVKTLRAFDQLWTKYFNEKVQDHPALYLLSNDVVSAEWDLPDGELTMSLSPDGFTLLHLGLELDKFYPTESPALAAIWVAERLEASRVS
ncbi:hypothetical protein IV102_01405 [bacterium]|nr:hypothetical protein [bacterium]